MAFCPNCGTPNTEQATQCVNCNNALTPSGSSGGGKFKGTIMMGVAGNAAAPKPPEEGAPAAGGQGGDAKNLAYQKTMMGPMVAPPAQAPAQPAAQPATPAAQAARTAQAAQASVAHAPTLEHEQPTSLAPSAAPRASQGFSQPAGHYDDEAPQLPQSNATKTMMMVLGASVVIAALIVGAALVLR